MKNFKYPLFALINLLSGIFLIIILSSNGFQLNTYFLTGVFLIFFGLSGFVQIFKYQNKEAEESKERLDSWLDLTKSVDVIFIIALLIRIFVFQPYIVDGASMEPNFHTNEFILVERVSYHYKSPQRGDVIVFHPPINPEINYIKRIIGLPNEKIDIKNGKVYVNDKIISEQYLSREFTSTEQSNLKEISVSLGDEQYFVLGDNRENSSDSRIFGPINEDSIIGKAFVVLMPINNFQFIKHQVYTKQFPLTFNFR